MHNVAHGFHAKRAIVLHETVSGDQRGLADIVAVEAYLRRIGYGIHGMTDREGHIAWASGLGRAVFWHAGGANTETIGIEQVFRGASNKPGDRVLWAVRQRELRATARLCACICRAHSIPLEYSDAATPHGITSHWDISQHHSASEGHWDCHPVHKGGYYPILQVVRLARIYHRAGWKF
jgi:N-acetylmuramoyl-L-alanine amidase